MSKPIYVQNTFKIGDSSDKKSKKKARRWKRNKALLITFLGMLLAVMGFGIYAVLLPAHRVLNSANRISENINALTTDLGGKDLSGIDDYVISIQSELESIHQEIDKYEFLANLSFTKGYYENLQVVQILTNQSKSLLDQALPELKVVLGSMGYITEAENGAETKADTDNTEEEAADISAVIKELPELVTLYEDLEPEILEMVETFGQINPEYIPSLGDKDYRGTVVSAQKLAADYPSVSSQLKETLSALPDLLGATETTSYLLILQNENEMRASGGLVSAFGVVNIDKGEIAGDISVTDTWDLYYDVINGGYLYQAPNGYQNIYGQRLLMERGCGAAYLRPQDSGIYPDLNVSMNMFADYYDAARASNPSKYPEYDHIITLNTMFASDLVSFIQPLEIKDDKGKTIKITAENLSEAIFDQTSTAYFDPSSRKSFIGEVATVAQEKVNSLQAEQFPEIFKTMISTMQAKNIAFASKNDNIQDYFDSLGISGRVEKNFDGDYFMFSEAQVCALKSNSAIKNEVTQNITIQQNGLVSKDVKVRWYNDTVYDPDKHLGVLTIYQNHLYRAWIRFFTPEGTEFTSTDGYERSRYIYYPQTYVSDVMERETSDNVIWYDYRRNTESDPPTEYDLNISYTLPGEINYEEDGSYRMLIQKHPGKREEKYTINVNHDGKVTSTELRLTRDMVVTYRNGIISVEAYDQRLDEYADLIDNLVGS